MARTEAASQPNSEGVASEPEGETVEPAAAEVVAPADQAEGAAAGGDSPQRRRIRVRWPRPTTSVAAVALLCAVALLAASGYMLRHHQRVQADERNRAEFVAAAKQVVVTLMSIDFNNPQDSVQRIIDNSTGPFRDEFQGAAEDFVRVSKDAKVTTKATVNVAAVESMTADSAVALVAASSTVTNAAGANEAPRNWRLTVDLQREGDQIKMSKVEFVP